eukprot:354043-Chlamydomonas_euryale.AAC.1
MACGEGGGKKRRAGPDKKAQKHGKLNPASSNAACAPHEGTCMRAARGDTQTCGKRGHADVWHEGTRRRVAPLRAVTLAFAAFCAASRSLRRYPSKRCSASLPPPTLSASASSSSSCVEEQQRQAWERGWGSRRRRGAGGCGEAAAGELDPLHPRTPAASRDDNVMKGRESGRGGGGVRKGSLSQAVLVADRKAAKGNEGAWYLTCCARLDIPESAARLYSRALAW